MLTDKEAEEIRRGLAAGMRGPVLIKWCGQLLADRDERRAPGVPSFPSYFNWAASRQDLRLAPLRRPHVHASGVIMLTDKAPRRFTRQRHHRAAGRSPTLATGSALAIAGACRKPSPWP